MKKSPNARTTGSFTLVEMMVVMAIIALLASLAAIEIPGALRGAHLAASSGNLRAIGGAIHAYASDHDTVLPTWYDYNQGLYWWQTLAPYLGDQGTNYSISAYHDPGDTGYQATNLAMTISYGYNYLVMGRGNDAGDEVPPQRLVNVPTATIALTDGKNGSSWGFIDPYGNGPDSNRYKGLTPALFLDGHVETMSVTNFNNPTPYFVKSNFN